MIFEAIVGTGARRDIAIDDLTILDGHCPPTGLNYGVKMCAINCAINCSCICLDQVSVTLKWTSAVGWTVILSTLRLKWTGTGSQVKVKVNLFQIRTTPQILTWVCHNSDDSITFFSLKLLYSHVLMCLYSTMCYLILCVHQITKSNSHKVRVHLFSNKQVYDYDSLALSIYSDHKEPPPLSSPGLYFIDIYLLPTLFHKRVIFV